MKSFIKILLREALYIGASIKDTLIKRIPFLKEYNIFDHPRDKNRLEAQKINYHKNVKVVMGGDIITFPQFNPSSEVIYYGHKVGDNMFHNFIINNKINAMQPEEMDDLTFRVFLLVKENVEKKLSYNKEYMVKVGETIPDDVLNGIINDMNKTMFEFEDYTNNHSIKLF
jgi:hypothetical protein